MMDAILVGSAVNFLSYITKKSKNAIKNLFSEDQLKSVLNQAYMEFKESYSKDGSEKIRLPRIMGFPLNILGLKVIRCKSSCQPE